MKTSLFPSVLAFLICGWILPVWAEAESVADVQKRILSRIEAIQAQRGVYVSGRAKFQYEYFTATGQAVDTNSAFAGTSPMIQSDILIEGRPFAFLKAGAVLRVQNDMEGFYGAGDLFEAREIWLEAILFRFLRIRFGDFGMALSPLSFWTEPDDSVYDAALFRLQREDGVYQAGLSEDNSLPLSGVMMDFGLDSETGLAGPAGQLVPTTYDFKAYVSRIDTATASKAYDRVMFGGSLTAANGPLLNAGVSGNFIYDLEPTRFSPEVKDLLGNDVLTLRALVNPLGAFKERWILELSGELGYSRVRTNRLDRTVLSDYGLVWKAAAGYSASRIWVKGVDVGNEYFAPAAQSWSRNRGGGDYLVTQGLASSLFFPVYDDRVQIVRRWDKPFSLTGPMGAATPNRKGCGIGLETKDLSFLEASGEAGMYEEVRPIGVTKRRAFTVMETGVKMSPGKLADLAFLPVLTGRFKFEHLTREEDLSNATNRDAEDLLSRTLTIGLELPLLKKLTLLGSYERSLHKGNCYFDDNDAGSTPLRITTHVPYAADRTVQSAGGGLLYTFGKGGLVLLDYTWLSYRGGVSDAEDYDLHLVRTYYQVSF